MKIRVMLRFKWSSIQYCCDYDIVLNEFCTFCDQKNKYSQAKWTGIVFVVTEFTHIQGINTHTKYTLLDIINHHTKVNYTPYIENPHLHYLTFGGSSGILDNR